MKNTVTITKMTESMLESIFAQAEGHFTNVDESHGVITTACLIEDLPAWTTSSHHAGYTFR